MKFRVEWTEEVTQHWETEVEAETEDEARELYNLGKHLNSKAECFHTSYNETSDDCIVQEKKTIQSNYEDGVCPDCGEAIPDTAVDGSPCSNCGHVFYS